MTEKFVEVELAIIHRADGWFVEAKKLSDKELGPLDSREEAEMYVAYLKDMAVKNGGYFIDNPGPKQ